MGKEYHIKLNGELIPVSEEVYRAYQRPKWREKKQTEARADRETSLDALQDSGFEPMDDRQALVDEIVADKLLLDELLAALQELTEDERFLIDELFYHEKSERELAKETGVPRKTIAYRKSKTLERLRKIIDKI